MFVVLASTGTKLTENDGVKFSNPPLFLEGLYTLHRGQI